MLKSPTKEPSGLGIGLCSLERPMGECSTHCGAGYLEKAKLSEPCLLRLKVSNRGGSHQALNVALVNFCGPGLFLGVSLSP